MFVFVLLCSILCISASPPIRETYLRGESEETKRIKEHLKLSGAKPDLESYMEHLGRLEGVFSLATKIPHSFSAPMTHPFESIHYLRKASFADPFGGFDVENKLHLDHPDVDKKIVKNHSVRISSSEETTGATTTYLYDLKVYPGSLFLDKYIETVTVEDCFFEKGMFHMDLEISSDENSDTLETVKKWIPGTRIMTTRCIESKFPTPSFLLVKERKLIRKGQVTIRLSGTSLTIAEFFREGNVKLDHYPGYNVDQDFFDQLEQRRGTWLDKDFSLPVFGLNLNYDKKSKRAKKTIPIDVPGATKLDFTLECTNCYMFFDVRLKFEMAFNYYAAYTPKSIKKFTLAFEGDYGANLELFFDIHREWTLDRETSLFKIKGAPITIILFAIPIVIVPELELLFHLNVEMKAGIQIVWSGGFGGKAIGYFFDESNPGDEFGQSEYEKAMGKKDNPEISSPQLTSTAAFSLDVRPSFEAKLTFTLWDSVGIYVSLEPYFLLKLRASLENFQDMKAKIGLFWGVLLNAGISPCRVPVIGMELTDGKELAKISLIDETKIERHFSWLMTGSLTSAGSDYIGNIPIQKKIGKSWDAATYESITNAFMSLDEERYLSGEKAYDVAVGSNLKANLVSSGVSYGTCGCSTSTMDSTGVTFHFTDHSNGESDYVWNLESDNVCLYLEVDCNTDSNYEFGTGTCSDGWFDDCKMIDMEKQYCMGVNDLYFRIQAKEEDKYEMTCDLWLEMHITISGKYIQSNPWAMRWNSWSGKYWLGSGKRLTLKYNSIPFHNFYYFSSYATRADIHYLVSTYHSSCGKDGSTFCGAMLFASEGVGYSHYTLKNRPHFNETNFLSTDYVTIQITCLNYGDNTDSFQLMLNGYEEPGEEYNLFSLKPLETIGYMIPDMHEYENLYVGIQYYSAVENNPELEMNVYEDWAEENTRVSCYTFTFPGTGAFYDLGSFMVLSNLSSCRDFSNFESLLLEIKNKDTSVVAKAWLRLMSLLPILSGKTEKIDLDRGQTFFIHEIHKGNRICTDLVNQKTCMYRVVSVKPNSDVDVTVEFYSANNFTNKVKSDVLGSGGEQVFVLKHVPKDGMIIKIYSKTTRLPRRAGVGDGTYEVEITLYESYDLEQGDSGISYYGTGVDQYYYAVTNSEYNLLTFEKLDRDMLFLFPYGNHIFGTSTKYNYPTSNDGILTLTTQESSHKIGFAGKSGSVDFFSVLTNGSFDVSVASLSSCNLDVSIETTKNKYHASYNVLDVKNNGLNVTLKFTGGEGFGINSNFLRSENPLVFQFLHNEVMSYVSSQNIYNQTRDNFESLCRPLIENNNVTKYLKYFKIAGMNEEVVPAGQLLKEIKIMMPGFAGLDYPAGVVTQNVVVKTVMSTSDYFSPHDDRIQGVSTGLAIKCGP